MHILFDTLNSNSSHHFFYFPEITWSPAAPKPGGKIHKFLTENLHPKGNFCQRTYPLTPKTKPILLVHAEVSVALNQLFSQLLTLDK